MILQEIKAIGKNKALYENETVRKLGFLTESCKILLPEQRIIVEGIYSAALPLIEISLKPDQINKAFIDIESRLNDSGYNKTQLGKNIDSAKTKIKKIDDTLGISKGVGTAVNTAKMVNDTLNKMGKWLQDTTPVKEFDKSFENLKKKIEDRLGSDSIVISNIKKFGDYARKNPGKTAAIIGLLTAVASIATGPAGGAIAGQLLRGAAELIKGEKLSTAIGKGVKTAALGYIAGTIADSIGNWISGLRAKYVDFDDGLIRISFNARRELSIPGFYHKQNFETLNAIVTSEDRQYVKSLVDLINNGDKTAFRDLYDFSKIINSKDYMQHLQSVSDQAKKYALENDKLYQTLEQIRKAAVAASQGAAAGLPAAKSKKTEQSLEHVNLSTNQINEIFESLGMQLNEGIWDKIKDTASKAISAGKEKIVTTAKNLTTQVTVDKLKKAWKEAGSPTDSEKFKEFLARKMGIDSAIIKNVMDAILYKPKFKLNTDGTKTQLS